MGKDNQVSPIQKDPKTGNARVDKQAENVALGTRNGVGKFTHSTETKKPISGDESYAYQKLDTEWITVKVYNPNTGSYDDKQVEVYKLTPGQYMDDEYNVRAKEPIASGYSTDAQYRDALSVYNKVADYYKNDKTRQSYYVSGATAVGVDNVAEGDHSTALGNKAKVLNSVGSFYIDKDQKLTRDQDAAYYFLKDGQITTEPQYVKNPDGSYYRDQKGYYVKTSFLTVDRLIDSTDAVAVGSDVTAEGRSAVAIGHQSYAKEYSVAIGENSVTDYMGVAIGKDNKAKYASTAIGHTNDANGYYTATLGVNNTARADESTAIGYGNSVDGQQQNGGTTPKATYTHVLGSNNTVKGSYNAVFGDTNKVTGAYALALGGHNTISGANTNDGDGEYGIAIGYGNTVEKNALALGLNSNSIHDGSIAIGKSVNTTGDNNNGATNSIAIGTKATVHMKNGIVLGNEAYAGNNGNNSEGAIAIGHQAKSSAGESIAIGTKATTGNNVGSTGMTNIGAIAIGSNSNADTVYDIAMGWGANTKNTANGGAIALGHNATIEQGGQASTAIGDSARVKENLHDAVALGSQAYADRVANHDGGYDPAAKSIAHGDSSSSTKNPVWNSTLAAVSVGSSEHDYAQQTRQITNVAAGKEDTDAVNVAQLKKVVDLIGNGGSSSTGSSIHDYSVKSVKPDTDTNYENKGATGDNALAAGVSASATGVRSVAVGNGAQALKPDSIALGTNAKADGIGATAIGQYNTASGQNSLAFGGGYNKDQKGNTASGVASVAFGEGTQAIAEGTLAFGQNTQAGVITTDDKGNIQIGGQDAVAFGRGTKALGGRSLAFGEDTVADFNDSVAFGAGTKALSTGSTAFGSRTRALAQYSTALGNSTVAAGTYSVAFGTDTVAGAVLDEHGAFQLKNGTKMDQHGNTAYTDSQGKTYSVTYTVPDGEKHSYVVLKGQGGKTYIRDYRGNIRTATIGNDGSVTVGGIVKGATEDKTLIKAKPGSNGYDLISNSNATAWGESSSASGEASTAFGIGSKAEGKNSLAALGGLAANDNSIAIGEGTKANNADKAVSLAIGQNAEASGERSLAIGFGVSEKVNDKDDKTLTSTKASGESAIAIGTDVVAQGQHSVAMGSHTDAAKDSSVAIGFDTHTVSDSAVAIGSGTRAEGRYSVALGLSSVAGKETNDAKNPLNGGGSVAIGYGTSAEASRSIAIGTGATAADSQFTTAVGDSTIAQAEGSVAIGAGSIATRGAGNKESTASTDVNTGKTTITYGDEKKAYLKPDELSTDKTSTWVSTTGAVSVGGQATYKEYNDNGNLVEKTKLLTRQITNVAAGSDDTDAVNVAQLKAAQPTVTSNDHSVTIDTTTDKTDYHKNYDLKIATATLSQDKTTGDNPVETGKVTVSNPKISVTENGETKQVDNPNAYVTGNSVADAINNSGFKLTASASEGDVTGNAETLIHPGDTMTIDAGKNISLTQTNGKISIATKDKLVLGKDTSDGKDGQEGTIGLTGKDGIPGTDGKQGYSTTIIKTEKGQPGSDGKNGKPGVDGKDITRIVYTDKDGSTPQTVATLSDGLKFAGDDISKTVEKKLNETLQIRGDGSYDKTTQKTKEDGNIQVSADTDTGTIKVALNKDINLKQDGSLTVGGNTQDGSKTVDDPIVIKHFDDKTLDMITGVDKDGKPISANKKAAAGDYVRGLDNKDWNVNNPEYVSGRAATEDQLKKVSDAVKEAATTAGKHTVVTVNDNKDGHDTKAKAVKGAFSEYAGTDKDNLLIAAKDDNGQLTYNIKLNDQLAIGQKGEPGVAGKDGKDGKVTVETKGGTTVVIGHDGEDGKDGISVKGQDGKDGVTISAVNGKDGSEGHIGLTGPKGADGKNATADIHVKNGQVGVDGTDGHGGKDGMDRVVYEDHNGVTHEVATMDDGQKYAGDFGDGASVKLNKTVTIKGKVKDGAKEDDFVDGNIAIVANKKGEDGELLIKLNKDLTGLNSATYTTSTKNGDVTTTSKTVVDGTGLKIDNGPSITNTGIDGGSKKITNVADGEISATSKDAVNGSQLNAVKTLAGQHTTVEAGSKNITVKEGTNSTGGKNYTVDLAKDVAFGDSAKGDKTVAISGTNGTVTAGTGDNKVTVDGSKGQIIAGGDNGVKIGNIAGGDSSLTIYDKDGKATNQTDQAGKYVTNLGNKTWNKDGSYVSGRAATEDQLHQVESNVNKQIADVNTKIDKVDKHHTEVTVNGGTPAKADGAYTDGNLQLKQTTGEDGQKVYDLKLNDQLKVGQKGDAGKAGKDGNVTVETKGGTTVVIGHDGKDGKDGRDGLFVTGKDGKDGKSGVSITGPNGAAGTDGVDGKVGIAGKDGRDAVSIAGKDGVGHIGLTGPKGADGKDGTNIDISTVLGKGTLDRNQNEVKGEDKDGTKDQAARIQYQTTVKEADGTTNTITHEVATMDDGMKYGDDFGNTAKVKLNHQLDIVGDINAGKKDGDKKATKDDLSDGNIGIVATDTVYNDDGTVKENGKMTVKLAKNLKGLNSIESNSVTTGNTTINNGGLTVKTGDSTHQDITIKQGNVNMGGNKIEGVAPGAVTPDSTDAVNGSQLYAAGQAISNLGGAVNKLGTRVDRVGAGSAALAALHPLDFDPDDKWDFAAGYGHYRGANAAAVGAYYRPNEDTMFSIGGSFGGGENMFNAGVSIKLGQGNHISTSRVAMAKEMEAMRRHMAEQDALIAKLESMHGMAEGPEKSALFPDVAENHWAYQYVTTLAKKGILEGYPDGEFKGDRMMTRYEFAAIVYRIVESGVGSTDPELSKLVREFSPELQYIRIDTIHRDDKGQPTVQRVRVKDRK